MASRAVDQLESFKARHTDNRMVSHLANTAISCKIRSRAYWDLNQSLVRASHMISIPLLLISSATGLTSAIQMFVSTTALQVVVVIFGVSTAFVSGLQKYFRYSERAENAKRYERLAKRISNRLILIEQSRGDYDTDDVQKWMSELESAMDNLIAEAEECLPRRFFQPFQIQNVQRDDKKQKPSIDTPRGCEYERVSIRNQRDGSRGGLLFIRPLGCRVQPQVIAEHRMNAEGGMHNNTEENPRKKP